MKYIFFNVFIIISQSCKPENIVARQRRMKTKPRENVNSELHSNEKYDLSMYKVKVLVIGPCKSGKTVLSNFLAEATESSSGEYHPTQGVRILEFESERLNAGGRTVKAEVELWDCSGDQKFESCWPATTKDSNGVIMVYSPTQNNIESQMDMWYSHFVQAQNLKDSQCIVFCHQRPGIPSGHASQLSSLFSRVPWVQSNIEENGNFVRQEFSSFIQRLLSTMNERRDQEELNIMNQH